MLNPASRSRSNSAGSVKPNSKLANWVLPVIVAETVWPRPRKLRSVRLICAVRPSLEEKAPPRLRLPVGCSSTSTSTSAWSSVGARLHVDRRGLEVAEAVDAVLGVLDLARVEGVALDDVELPPDHPVERAGVAGDVDALDEDPLALDQLEVDVDGAVGGVLGHLRPDLDEGVAGLAGLVGHALRSTRSTSLTL